MTCGSIVCDYILSLLLRLPVLVSYGFATALQCYSAHKILDLIEEKKSICVYSHEISGAVSVYLMFIICPVIPNACYVLGILLLPRLCRDPMSIVYNVTMGTMGIVGFLVLQNSLTFCGNEDQQKISDYDKLGLIAGGLHTFNAVYIHLTLPWKEGYVRRSQQLTFLNTGWTRYLAEENLQMKEADCLLENVGNSVQIENQ